MSEVCHDCNWLKASWGSNLFLRNKKTKCLSLTECEMLHLLKYNVKRQKKKAFSLKIPFINIRWTVHISPLNCCQKLSKITWKMEQKWDYKVSYGYLIIFSVSTVKGYLRDIKESSHVSRWVSINVAQDNHCRWMPQFSQASGKYIQHGGAWVWAFIRSAFDERKQFLSLGFVSKAQRTREELSLWQPAWVRAQPQPGCREPLVSLQLKRMHVEKI